MTVADNQKEFVFLRPKGVEDKRVLMWLCLMVEMGIDFDYDDAYQLPTKLPGEPGNIKIVAIYQDDWEAYHQEYGKTLKHYEECGVTVYQFEPLGDGDGRTREAWVRMDLEMVLVSQPVKLNHPRARERLQNRDFDQLLSENREFLLRQLSSVETPPRNKMVWGDPHAYGMLEPALLYRELDVNFNWSDRLEKHLESVIESTEGPPIFKANIAGLGALIDFGLEIERQGFIDFAIEHARALLKGLRRYEGVPINKPGQGDVPRVETLSFLLPNLSAVAKVSGEDMFLDEAIHAYDVTKELCYDETSGLWHHGGRRDWRCPVVWGRGSGFALSGLVGLLEHLPEKHLRYEEIRTMLESSISSLKKWQTEEGMLRNVINHPDSRPDISATTITTWSLANALNKGWVKGREYEDMLENAWRAIRGRLFRDRGCTTTEGTSVGSTLQFYLSRLHHFNSCGYILHAGAAYERWKRTKC